MGIDEILVAKRMQILALAEKHGACNIRVFGSTARGDAGPDSDVDLLIDMEPGRSLLDLTAFWTDVCDLLGRKVDIVTESGVYWLLRRRILKEAHPL